MKVMSNEVMTSSRLQAGASEFSSLVASIGSFGIDDQTTKSRLDVAGSYDGLRFLYQTSTTTEQLQLTSITHAPMGAIYVYFEKPIPEEACSQEWLHAVVNEAILTDSCALSLLETILSYAKRLESQPRLLTGARFEF